MLGALAVTSETCSFWARDLALWESLCHLRWPATKQLKGVENHRTLFFNALPCENQSPRRKSR